MNGKKTFSTPLTKTSQARGYVTPPDVNLNEVRAIFAARRAKAAASGANSKEGRTKS